MRYYKTEGIIIKTRPLGEADKIYTVLTADYGKIEIKAKSARLIKSKLAGKLEVFNRVKLYLAKGKTLDIITAAEVLSAHLNVRNSLVKVAAGFYLLELFNKAVVECEKDYKVYLLLKQGLKMLNDERDLDVILRAAEVRLLYLLGYQPILDRCASCKSKSEKLDYFNVILGGALCGKCCLSYGGSLIIYPATREVMKYFQKWDINGIKRLKLTDEVLKNISKINTMFYMAHFNFKISSQDFINKLKQEELVVV